MDAYQKMAISKRREWHANTEIALPTLAHVPGVEPSERYTTTKLRMRGRQAVLTPHAALLKPRAVMTSARPRLVHLGQGRVLFE